MKDTDRWLDTAYLLECAINENLLESEEAAVREVARLLRERHPELCEPPWTPGEDHCDGCAVCLAVERRDNEHGVTLLCEHCRTPPPTDPPWTPVAEGLPEEDGRYAVTEKLYGARRTGCSNFRDGKWYSPYEVLAWRPAPLPWSGGGA